jgi:signal transduction histidine kinase
LSNGLKYGGRPPRLLLGYEHTPAGFVRFWVEDNGAGIKLDDPLLLFTPNYRQRRGSSSGYGLGLSIVQRIIHRLGGAVGVEKAAGGGSRFSFTLPTAPRATASKE